VNLPDWAPKGVDVDKASAARLYDYFLGGSYNFEVDRELGRKLGEAAPGVYEFTRLNRSFLRRAVRYLCERGIDQFLDIGSGIPTAGNVHEIAQHAAPGSRVVYVDYEGVAVAHSKLLLAGNADAVVLQRDVTRPDDVLDAEETRSLIDFSRPVGVLPSRSGTTCRLPATRLVFSPGTATPSRPGVSWR